MGGKWVVIYIAHGDSTAGQILELLEGEGFLCRSNPLDRSDAGNGTGCHEISTLFTEAQEARDLLQERGY